MLTVDLARLGASTGVRVLDLGAGGGRHTFAALRTGATTVAFDRSESEVGGVVAMVAAMRAERELTVEPFAPTVGDATRLPFADGVFDVVVASEILEHLVEDASALREVARVLRPHGALAISVPRRGPERVNWALSRAYHEVEGGHVRIYDRRTLEERVSAAGLKVTGRTHRHGLHSPYWWLRCAVGVERDDHRLVVVYHRLLVWEIEHQPLCTRLLGAVLDPLIGKSLVLYCEKVAE